MNLLRTTCFATAISLTTLGGCGLLYDIKAGDEQRQCDRLPNMNERNACLQRLQQMNKEVQRNRSEAKQAEPAADAPTKPDGMCFRRAATQELVCPN